MLGSELAWMVVEPTATPVTAKVALEVPAAIVTEAGTVAVLGLSELSVTVTGTGVFAGSFT